MALVDEITIQVSAGRGGDGVVRWLHERNREFGGPLGGDGGRGGDVFAEAVRDMGALARYRNIKTFRAERGGAGKSKAMHGKNGEPLTLRLPLGSVILNKETGERFELLQEGERVLLLKGGEGGFGNMRFKGSMHQRPKESTPGKTGESAHLSIELQLIADAGLIGLPNAGKSSLLNALTKARAKIGSYEFTTLEPNLGVMDGYVLADIPGLIEGAAEGKGLGDRFLRHIRRTRTLVHCISAEQKDPMQSYDVIREELRKYDAALLDKPEIILCTKTDLLGADALKERLKLLKSRFSTVYAVSVLDSRAVRAFGAELGSIISGYSKAKEPKKAAK